MLDSICWRCVRVNEEVQDHTWISLHEKYEWNRGQKNWWWHFFLNNLCFQSLSKPLKLKKLFGAHFFFNMCVEFLLGNCVRCFSGELLLSLTLSCVSVAEQTIFSYCVLATGVFYHRGMASLWGRHHSLRVPFPHWQHLAVIVSTAEPACFIQGECIQLTLTRRTAAGSLWLQGLFLSDWVRVPLTFSHFTETVLKRPSQSPGFMAQPSQGPADLMDITRINQTFMPTRSSPAGAEAWLCAWEWHQAHVTDEGWQFTIPLKHYAFFFTLKHIDINILKR